MNDIKNITSEDYTAGVLAGIPIFCINRVYSKNLSISYRKTQCIFKFDNGFGASIIEFYDRDYSGGEQYELAVLDGNGQLIYDTGITEAVERGDAKRMHELLCQIETLDANRSKDL